MTRRTARFSASLAGLVASVGLAYGGADRTEPGARRVEFDSGEAATAAVAADPLCRLCSCPVVARTVETIEPGAPSTICPKQVFVLVDTSGSFIGWAGGWKRAQRCKLIEDTVASLNAAATRRESSTSVSYYGLSDSSPGGLRKLGLASGCNSWTATKESRIEEAVQSLLDKQSPGERNGLIVLSDGFEFHAAKYDGGCGGYAPTRRALENATPSLLLYVPPPPSIYADKNCEGPQWTVVPETFFCGAGTGCTAVRADDAGVTSAQVEHALCQTVPTERRTTTTTYGATFNKPRAIFPEAVLVGDGEWKCSGVVVGPRHVLTAGHCAAATRVGVGEGKDEAHRAFAVTSVERHPTLDAAVLVVDAPLGVSEPPLRTTSDPPAGYLRHVGFGAVDARGRLGFGRKKVIDVVTSEWGCDGARIQTTSCRPNEELVLPGSAGADTCFGDSGGPLFELVSSAAGCTWQLLAITSRRIPDANAACGGGGIYTRVDAIALWVGSIVKRGGSR